MKTFKMNQRVVVPKNWIDTSIVCKGTIMGIEKVQNGTYLGAYSFEEYKSRFTRTRYKLIYEHNGRIYEEWFSDTELEKVNN